MGVSAAIAGVFDTLFNFDLDKFNQEHYPESVTAPNRER